MKKIGLIVAMKEELNAALEEFEVVNEFKIFDMTFYECKSKNKTCILVQCGVGKVNAARCAQILIDKLEIDCIINIGVAGSVSKDVNIYDVVVGEKLVQHDFDLKIFDHKRGHIPNVGIYMDCDPYLVKLAKDIKIDSKVHLGTVASGDIFVTELSMGEKINKKFNALCVEMEGAAIAQACYLSNVPFLVIRSISDSPNKDANNHINFDEFVEERSKVSVHFLKQLLDKIK